MRTWDGSSTPRWKSCLEHEWSNLGDGEAEADNPWDSLSSQSSWIKELHIVSRQWRWRIEEDSQHQPPVLALTPACDLVHTKMHYSDSHTYVQVYAQFRDTETSRYTHTHTHREREMYIHIYSHIYIYTHSKRVYFFWSHMILISNEAYLCPHCSFACFPVLSICPCFSCSPFISIPQLLSKWRFVKKKNPSAEVTLSCRHVA